MKIGFFDSGLGGLTVMKAVVKHLPEYDYEFYGDTANLPYGDKTEEEIFELTKAGMVHLFEKGCVLVIIACNTASAETLRKLQDTFLVTSYPDRKILGVIIPMVETVIEALGQHALLLATKRTVESAKYEKEFEKMENRPTLRSIATAHLVPLIEAGKIEEAVHEAMAIIDQNKELQYDSLVLGCTHYALLREGIEAKIDSSVKVFSADQVIPKKIKLYLDQHSEIETRLTRHSTRNVYLSVHTPHYDKIMSEILGGYLLSE